MEGAEQAGVAESRHPHPSSQDTVKRVKISAEKSGSVAVAVAFELSLEKPGALGWYRSGDHFPGKGASQEGCQKCQPRGGFRVPHIS